MIKITLRLPRKQKDFIHYVGDANEYLNRPIISDDKPIGNITRIIEDTDEYTEVEGILYNAGIDFIKREGDYIPSDVTILKPNRNI